tara:strand:- start:63 stop:272 length:210 start_codon:yes stop_codon:yes gene_type:complete
VLDELAVELDELAVELDGDEETLEDALEVVLPVLLVLELNLLTESPELLRLELLVSILSGQPTHSGTYS